MSTQRMADVVRHRLGRAASMLGVTDPTPDLAGLLNRTFDHPADDDRYAFNTLTPGAAPFEPSFSEVEPDNLRFVLEPLGPDTSPAAKRDEATREARRLIGAFFGPDALRWFDRVSEEFRGQVGSVDLDYGAWFGTSYDQDGVKATKVYYELAPGQGARLTPEAVRLVDLVRRHLPAAVPAFVTIGCAAHQGSHRVTFLPQGTLRLKELESLMGALQIAHQLPGLMHIVGLTLGGRFDLPPGTCLLGIGRTADGPELKLEIALGMLPDLPKNFLDLLVMGLRERPRQLQALARWMRAFTPEDAEWPGNFSVLSVRTSATRAPRLSVYLRPSEMEIGRLHASSSVA